MSCLSLKKKKHKTVLVIRLEHVFSQSFSTVLMIIYKYEWWYLDNKSSFLFKN